MSLRTVKKQATTGRVLGSIVLSGLALGAVCSGGNVASAAVPGHVQAVPSLVSSEPVGIPLGGVFSPASVWRTDIRAAPIGVNSQAQVSSLVSQVQAYYGGTAAFNNYQYGVSWYNVSADQPRQTVLYTNCQRKTRTPEGLYGPGGQFEAVPIPADAVPTAGTDGTISVYESSTDTLWNFWKAYQDSAGWHACWGGRIDDVSTSLGQFSGYFGASASGLAYEGGAVSLNDVRSGVINHAVALSLPRAALSKEVSWPATRGDGTGELASAIPQGSRLRLDPAVDVSQLKLTPIAAMIARAAQTHGFLVTDTSTGVAVPAESPQASIKATGSDPWPALMGTSRSYQIMKGFPWDRLQVLPKDYGRP